MRSEGMSSLLRILYRFLTFLAVNKGAVDVPDINDPKYKDQTVTDVSDIKNEKAKVFS
jgi:hypothetical protein